MVGLMAASKRAYAKGDLPGLLLPVTPACGELLPTRASTECLLRLAGSFGSVSWGFAAPFLWVLVWKIVFVPSKTGVSVSSILMEVLKLNPAGLQGQIPQEFLVPLSDPQAGNPDVGLRTSTSGRTSLVLLFSSFWVAYLVGMGFAFTVIVPLPLPWLCLWMWGIVFWCVPASSC